MVVTSDDEKHISLPSTSHHTVEDFGPDDSLSQVSATRLLLRTLTRYAVNEMYGEKDENRLHMRRTKTRETILSNLEDRANAVANLPADGDLDDAQKQIEQRYQNTYENRLPEDGEEFADYDPELVTWDGDDDPKNPRNWSKFQKCLQTFFVAAYTFISPMSSTMPSPAIHRIAPHMGLDSDFLQSFSISFMVLAWALGPLLIAPLSESPRIGRAPVLQVSIWVAFAFNMGCAWAPNAAAFCIFRFLGGLGGCSPLNVGAGCLADYWADTERSVAIGVYSLAPSLGPVLAPVISSFITDYADDYRWVFWVLCILNFAVAVVGAFFLKESYAPKILGDKARKLRKETGNEHYRTIYEMSEVTGQYKWEKWVDNLTRPIILLTTNILVLLLGLFMLLVYGLMYLMIVTFPGVFQGTYGWRIANSGLAYLSMGVGFIIGVVFWTWAVNKIYSHKTTQNGDVGKAEYRLPCLIAAGIGVPVGQIWYGFSAAHHVHWIMPMIGAAIFGFFLQAVFASVQQFLIQMNNRYAALSIAAAAVFRSLFGFAFPLFAKDMYKGLGYDWGSFLFAMICLAAGVPFPLYVLFRGEKLVEMSNRRMDRRQAKKDAKYLERARRKGLISDEEYTSSSNGKT